MRLLATFRLDTAENVLSEAEALALTDEFVINTVSVNIGIMRSLCIYDDWTISQLRSAVHPERSSCSDLFSVNVRR